MSRTLVARGRAFDDNKTVCWVCMDNEKLDVLRTATLRRLPRSTLSPTMAAPAAFRSGGFLVVGGHGRAGR